jgi:hypothetical protein
MRRRLLVPLLAVVAMLLSTAAPAAAATTSWAVWDDLSGAGGAYSTTMRLQAPGFPAARMTSDSRASAQLPSGTSTFLRPATPPGAAYGSSAGNRYVNLRPAADNASSPSTTTYTFDTATPDAGWAFVLGDIDADRVRVTATDAGGAAVPAEVVDRWFRGTFNYAPGGSDLPTWDPATSTLTGNPAAADTEGASGWFEPDVPLSSLTTTFTWRSGFPVYQTWFASRAQAVGGTVTDVSAVPGCDLTSTTLELVGPDGGVVATAAADADGAFTFGDVAMRSDWRVRQTPPAPCVVSGDAEVGVDNTGAEGAPESRAALAVQAAVHTVSGVVRDGDGEPLEAVEVTLTPPEGDETESVATEEDGAYAFPDTVDGEGYVVEALVPEGYEPGPAGATVEVDVDGRDVTVPDIVLVEVAQEEYAIAGRVTDAEGEPLAGVEVELTPPGDLGGEVVSTQTDQDGVYVLEGNVDGDGYAVEAVVPEGYEPGPAGATVEVDVDGADVTVPDIVLVEAAEQTYAVSGSVTDASGAPLEQVEVTLAPPGGGDPVSTATGVDGTYRFAGVPDGEGYLVGVDVPSGYQPGPGGAAVEVDVDGADVSVPALVLVAVEGPGAAPEPGAPPAVAPPPLAGPPPGAGGGGGGLPVTGADLAALPWSVALLLVGAAAVLWSRRRAL